MKDLRSILSGMPLGYPGAIAVLAIAFLVFPIVTINLDDGAEALNSPPSTQFETISADLLVNRIDATTEAIFDAFNRDERHTYLGFFMDDAVILINGAPLVSGICDIEKMYLRSPPHLSYDPIGLTDQRIARCGELIIETGLAEFRSRFTSDGSVFNDSRQYLTIWKDSGKGLLKVKALAWNALANPAELERSNAPIAFDRPIAEEKIRAATRMHIEKLEKDMHEAVAAMEFEKGAAYYAENTTSILPNHTPIYGRERLLAYLNALAPHEIATSIERYTVRIEGNEDLAIVTNLFRWTFEPSEAEVPVTVQGKGIHIWERGRSGVWRILYDLPNASEKSG